MRFPFLAGHTAVLSAVCILLCLAPTGCGGKSATECRVLSINVGPGAATVNHAAAPPGNTQQFLAFVGSEPSGCSFAQSNLTTVVWSVSDPVNASISNVQGLTYGVATCKAATAGTVIVTGTLSQTNFKDVSGTASLTCN